MEYRHASLPDSYTNETEAQDCFSQGECWLAKKNYFFPIGVPLSQIKTML